MHPCRRTRHSLRHIDHRIARFTIPISLILNKRRLVGATRRCALASLRQTRALRLIPKHLIQNKLQVPLKHLVYVSRPNPIPFIGALLQGRSLLIIVVSQKRPITLAPPSLVGKSPAKKTKVPTAHSKSEAIRRQCSPKIVDRPCYLFRSKSGTLGD